MSDGKELIPFLRTVGCATEEQAIALCGYAADQIEGQAARIAELQTENARLREVIAKLGTYGFECEAGPLTNCKEWQDAVAE